MARVGVSRAYPASSFGSRLPEFPSLLQRLVKSIRQVKDLNDVFSFRYMVVIKGRKHTKGWERGQVSAGRSRVENRKAKHQQTAVSFTCCHTELRVLDCVMLRKLP